MEIEKGKLYYDTRTNQLFKAHNYEVEAREGITDKIAVHCPTKDDKLYVAKKYGLEWVENNAGFNEPYVDLADDYLFNVNYSGFTCYHIITIDQFKEFYPPDEEQEAYVCGSIDISNKNDDIIQNDELKHKEVFNPKPYYDNSKGSLYKVATERGWNAYLFDLVKRLERGGKKDPLRQEIEKSIDVLKIWLNELDE